MATESSNGASLPHVCVFSAGFHKLTSVKPHAHFGWSQAVNRGHISMRRPQREKKERSLRRETEKKPQFGRSSGGAVQRRAGKVHGQKMKKKKTQIKIKRKRIMKIERKMKRNAKIKATRRQVHTSTRRHVSPPSLLAARGATSTHEMPPPSSPSPHPPLFHVDTPSSGPATPL